MRDARGLKLRVDALEAPENGPGAPLAVFIVPDDGSGAPGWDGDGKPAVPPVSGRMGSVEIHVFDLETGVCAFLAFDGAPCAEDHRPPRPEELGQSGDIA